MAKLPWDVTREMFLDEDEVEVLRQSVETAVRESDGRRRLGAMLDRLIIECLLFSGLRSSEFCRLTLGDAAVSAGRCALEVRGPGDQSRTVCLPAHVGELIRQYIRDVRPAFLPEGTAGDAPSQVLVFSEHRQPFQRSGLYRRVVKVLTAAGLGSRASVQLLRHTYGYLAYLRTGGNLLFVQRQLGHAHPMVTMVYAKFVPESYGEMADRVFGRPSGREAPARLEEPQEPQVRIGQREGQEQQESEEERSILW